MARKSAPCTKTSAAMAFSSFRKAIGIATRIKVNMHKAFRWLTTLSKSYNAKATKTNRASPMRCAAMPRRNSVSEAAMLRAVSRAFPSTISLLGT